MLGPCFDMQYLRPAFRVLLSPRLVRENMLPYCFNFMSYGCKCSLFFSHCAMGLQCMVVTFIGYVHLHFVTAYC